MSKVVTSQSRLVQVAACLGFVVVLTDVSVVNVALGELRIAFATGMSGLQWVVNAYTLAFASLLLTAGALGDRLGARQVFMAGFALFTIASLCCGLAPNLNVLVFARFVQGVGAALLVPNSLSLLRQVFDDPKARNRAVGWWGAAGGIALAAGPVVGGYLIFAAGWRSIFLVNIPLGLLGLWLTARYASPSPRQPRRGFDLVGQIAIGLALASLTTSLTEASDRGWTDPVVVAGLVLAVLLAIVFVRVEANDSSAMLPLDLFRNTTLCSATGIGLIANLTFYGGLFFLSLYFQVVRHLDPKQTGLAFLPMLAILMVVNVIAGRAIEYLGPSRLTAIGLSISALGYILLLRISATTPYSMLFVPMLLAGSGIALVVPTITNATLSSVSQSRVGIASGLLNSARQVGGMIGVALFGYLVRQEDAPSFMRGMHEAIALTIALLLFGAIVGLFGIRHQQSLTHLKSAEV